MGPGPVANSNITNMAFRGGNRRSGGGGGGGGGGGSGFGGGNYGGGAMGGGRMNPWDSTANPNYGGMRQGGGGGVMQTEALTLANNLINNLLRNRNPPSLLDLPGAGGGSMGGNRGPRGQMGNRAGNRNRRAQGNFGRGGPKAGAQKQGGGIRKQNAFDRAKKLLAKNSNKKKDSAPDDKTEKKKNESEKESIYADVPNVMFYCHLCKKHMWDATSFENHIKGRTHLMMREGIEESYRLKANMIRQEAKIAEQLKLIELDRLKRMGKSKAHQREYCTMCDLNFHGHLSAHRKTEGHLHLKKFLHPKCIECSKEFPTRIEYDTHLLTPEHLKKAAERNTKVGERKKNTLTILTEEDEIKDVRQPQKKKKKTDSKKEGEGGESTTEGGEKKENGEAGDDAEGVEAAEGDEEKKEGEEGVEHKEEDEEEDANITAVEDPDDCILDYHDGDEVPAEIDARIPKYNCQRPVGLSLISKLQCFECAVCCKFFDNEKTAEVHSRTVTHHRHFVKFLNEKASDTKIAQKRAAAALEENERKKRKIEERETAEKEGEGENAENAENGEEGEGGEGEEKANDELYDPSEATGDDEEQDAEMNELNAGQNVEEQKEEINGKIEDVEMKEEEPKEEPKEIIEQPQEIEKKEPEKPEPKASPQKQQTAASNKNTPNRQAQGKGTPRSRGRGRYNRY